MGEIDRRSARGNFERQVVSDSALAEFLGEDKVEGETDPDDTPELPKKPIVKACTGARPR